MKNLGRRERKRSIARQERKNAWLAKYGSAEALQQTFGNTTSSSTPQQQSPLSPTQTRALYHALLPRSLLALSELDVLDPSDLAPLAYQARIAAKEYARSRSSLGSTIMTTIVDQYRNIKNGKGLLPFKPNDKSCSMTWDDVWEKYEKQIMDEERVRYEDNPNNAIMNEEELMMQIYMRILEKSCATNEAFDGIFLKDGNGRNNDNNNNEEEEEDDDELSRISSQLEADIQSILLDKKDQKSVMKQRQKKAREQIKIAKKQEKGRIKTIKEEEKEHIKFRKREEKLMEKLEKRRRKQHDREDEEIAID